jgi:hypothetical protein
VILGNTGITASKTRRPSGGHEIADAERPIARYTPVVEYIADAGKAPLSCPSAISLTSNEGVVPIQILQHPGVVI